MIGGAGAGTTAGPAKGLLDAGPPSYDGAVLCSDMKLPSVNLAILGRNGA